MGMPLHAFNACKNRCFIYGLVSLFLSISHAEPRAPSCASTNVMTDPVSGSNSCGLGWPVVCTQMYVMC